MFILFFSHPVSFEVIHKVMIRFFFDYVILFPRLNEVNRGHALPLLHIVAKSDLPTFINAAVYGVAEAILSSLGTSRCDVRGRALQLLRVTHRLSAAGGDGV